MKYRIIKKNGKYYPQFYSSSVDLRFHFEDTYGRCEYEVCFANKESAKNYIMKRHKENEIVVVDTFTL